MITLTAEMIEALATPKGGYNSKTLHRLGVAWPPVSGWKDRLIGTDISDQAYRDAQRASGNDTKLPKATPKKPPPRRAAAGVIIAWLKAHWAEVIDGAALCDRCPARSTAEPCKACPHWQVLVDSYRAGDI